MNHHSKKLNGNYRFTMVSSTNSTPTLVGTHDDEIGHINIKNKIFKDNHYYYFGKRSIDIMVKSHLSIKQSKIIIMTT